MVRSSFVKFEGKYFGSSNGTNNNSSYLHESIDEAKILISTSLTLLTGIFHVGFL